VLLADRDALIAEQTCRIAETEALITELAGAVGARTGVTIPGCRRFFAQLTQL
jgi:hypothetical protein